MFAFTTRVAVAGLLMLLSSPVHSQPLELQPTETLSLQDAVSLAMQLNPDILKAQQEINAAEGRILTAERIANPDINFTWNESPSLFNFSGANEQDIGIAQFIEYPTKVGRRIDVAVLDKERAELNLERVKRLSVASVTKAYYDLLYAQETIDNLQQHIQLLADFQNVVAQRYEIHQGAYLDVVRARVEIARANNELIEATRLVRQKETELQLLLGRASENRIHLSDSLVYVHSPLQSDSLFTAGLRQSATLQLATLTQSRQEQFLALSKTTYLPDFGVGISRIRRGSENNLWGMEFKVSVPLWFWKEPRGQVQEATALLQTSTTILDQTDRRVRTNIMNAFNVVQAADAQVQAFNTSVLQDVRDMLSIAATQYSNNQLDVLNLLDVYRTHREVRTEYLRAVSQYMIAVAALEYANELSSQE